ncbi:MAG: hypothetical protein K2X70_00565 [Candidatus Obscuribacterales bacterium]|nr:hypothetical protein [Candidatus Obscuribacterales bacterium]
MSVKITTRSLAITFIALLVSSQANCLGANAGETQQSLFKEAEKLRIRNSPYEAEPLYRKLLVKDPNNFRYQAGLGAVLTEINRLPEAKTALDRAVALNPRDPGTRQALAMYYIRIDDKSKARIEFKKMLALDPRRNCHCGGVQAYLGLDPVKKPSVRQPGGSKGR